MTFTQTTGENTAQDSTLLCPLNCSCEENFHISNRQTNSDENNRIEIIPKSSRVDTHATDGGKKRRKKTAKAKKIKEAKKEQKQLKEALQRQWDDTHQYSEEELKRRRKLKAEYRELYAEQRPEIFIGRGIKRILESKLGRTAVVSAPTKEGLHKIITSKGRKINFDVPEE